MSTQASQQPPQHAAATRHFKVVIVGGGTGGITAAAQLGKSLGAGEVAIVDPAENHDYQPQWTLVGAGVVDAAASRHTMASVIPKKATWIKDAVTAFDPAQNQVVLRDGGRLGYDFLVVAAGIKLNWEQIRGLTPELIGQHGICSNYTYDGCQTTWRTLQAFRGGNAVFTMPPPPIKCAGAPQKIMYLAEDYMVKQGVREKANVIYAAGTPGIFSVKEFAKTLDEVLERKRIDTRFKTKLVEIRPEQKQAVFAHTESGEESVIDYEMIHICPPQGPPDVVKDSPLANEAGWCNVDKHTLQHPDFPNVFSLGDASSLPTSKTGAAIRKEAPVLVKNLLATMAGQSPASFGSYDGYASCPLTTGYGKLVLAEFDYDLKPAPSFPFDTTKERWSMYQLKVHGLPRLYWNGMLKGRG